MRGLVIAALAIGVAGPMPGSAQTPEQQRDEVRRQAADAAAQIDALRAEDAVVQQALADINANVTAQQADLDAATAAQQAADAAVAEADAAVAAAEQQVADLQATTDALLVEAFVDPPINHTLEIFQSGSLTDAAVKQALIKIQADEDAALMEQLEQAEAQLVTEQTAKRDAAAVADTRRTESEAALAELETALAQQQQLAADLEERLNARLAEAESLRQQDASLSAQIEAEQAALAARLAAIAPAGGGSAPTIQEAPGGLATVSCPTGGSITVAGDIADDLAALLAAASADGVNMCGGGWRDPEAQIQLRMAHCGTSTYAIYEMPASQCSPPTAKPGSSQHEVGLAIDFTCNGGGTISSRSSPCFTWLAAHADEYGFYNLPEEPWHWSTTGR